MAALPSCPNYRDGRCERSELILLWDDVRCYKFFCRNCKLEWVVTKDNTKKQARELNRVKRLKDLSEREQTRIKTFYAPKKGWL